MSGWIAWGLFGAAFVASVGSLGGDILRLTERIREQTSREPEA